MRQLVWGALLLVACTEAAPSWRGAQQSALAPSPAQPLPQLNTADASVVDLAPSNFFALGGRVYFIGEGKGAGVELWSSDGTAVGTDLVRDISVGAGNAWPSAFTQLQGKLLFAATEGNTGTEVWSSDGTRAGTGLVVDLAPPGYLGFSSGGAGRGSGPGFALFGNAAYFAGPSGHLVRTDGTAAGTVQVSSLNWASDYDGSPITAWNGELYGSASTGFSQGFELYAHNPADGGSRLVSELVPGNFSSYPLFFTPSGAHLFFFCRSPGSDIYLCVTEGTGARYLGRAQKVSVFEPHPQMHPFDGGVLLRACGEAPYPRPTQLFRSDGTDAGGYQLVKVLNPGGDAWASAFVDYNGKVYFIAYDNSSGWEVWNTDGVDAGKVTALANGFAEDPSWRLDKLLVPFAGGLYFCASSDGFKSELWKLDSAADGGASPALCQRRTEARSSTRATSPRWGASCCSRRRSCRTET